MSTLTLATTRRYFGFGNLNDYVVLNGGRVIGRIIRKRGGRAVVLDDHAMEKPPSFYNRGYSTTRAQAMADFKAHWLL